MRYRLRVDRLQSLLSESRLSQNHWAQKLGLSRGHWSDIVNGRHPFPSAKTRQRMLELFNVAESMLFDVVDDAKAAIADFPFAIASRYELTGELGQGGMGTVYLAHDRSLGRLVAIKVVATEAVAGIGADGLLQEIAHIARLQHPNILPVHEAEVRAGHPYYVMPYVREGSLAELLKRRGKLPLHEVINLAEQLSRALAYAHARQVLHCDIKPQNILVQDGHVWLMDFGIARKLHSEAEEWIGLRKELDFSAGTPAYVSPEQAAGDRLIDERSDVYSLACVVYEMLAGRAPFVGTTTEEVVSQRFEAPPAPLRSSSPEIPEHVAQVVTRAMCVNPAERPQSATDFITELRSAIALPLLARSTALSHAQRIARALSSRIRNLLKPQFRFTGPGTMTEFRYVFRGIVRNWRFSLGVILSLGLGIGLGVPVLGIADHLFLRPPPGVAEPDRVVKLIQNNPGRGKAYLTDGLTGLDYGVFTTRSRAFENVAGWINLGLNLGRGANAKRLSTTFASASFFNVLGVRPLAGRFYADNEDIEGVAAAPCVVSYNFWRRSMNGKADALGSTLQIGSVMYSVVGIAPEGFNGTGLNAVDVWLPLHVATPEYQGRDADLWTTDHSSGLRLIARLKPGVSIAAATEDATLTYRSAGVRTRDPELKGSMLLDPLQPGRSSMANSSAKIAFWLSAGGLMLLLLIGANLVNLFLARNGANARQIAIRMAIGGGRKQLLRLHAIEILQLGFIAAAVGLLLSIPTARIARSLILPGVVWVRPVIDVRIALVSFAIVVGIGIAVALWTTLQAGRLDPADLLRNAGSAQMAGTRSSHRARRTLIMAQAAMLAVLLSGASAFVLSLRRANTVDVGFDLPSVMSLSIARSAGTTSVDEARDLSQRVFEQVSRLPEIASATQGYMEPWANNTEKNIFVPGSTITPPRVLFDVATPSYVKTFGLQMQQGRWIEDIDQAGTQPVMVINETLERVFWPRGTAIGKCIRVGADSMPCRTVVGVVRDFRVTEGVDGPMKPVYYLPTMQAHAYPWIPSIFFRPRGSEADAVAAVRRTVLSVQADVAGIEIHALRKNIEWLVKPLQLGTAVFTAFGLLAGVVAAIGLYSVLSFLVTEQSRSQAIRMALGASSAQVARPVIQQAIVTIFSGMAVGFFLVALLGEKAASLLFHTRLLEPTVAICVAALCAFITVIAVTMPVLRVLKTDAMAVLRDQ